MTDYLFRSGDGDADRPLTINKVASMTRFAWAGRTKRTREEWHALAHDLGVRRLVACVVTATPLHVDRRTPQDVGACAPEVKAAIDGLVDAGMLDDDGPGYVQAITYRPPRVCGVNGLELAITEVPAASTYLGEFR